MAYSPPRVAFFTPLPIEDAKRIGEAYGLNVEAVTGVALGSVNSSYELGLAGGERVFLRIFEQNDAAGAAQEVAMLSHLAARGVATPRPLERADGAGFLSSHAQKPVALFPWVEGQSLCQKLVTPSITFRVGEALARVHIAGADYQGAPASRFSPEKLAARLAAIPRAAQSDELAAAIRELHQKLQKILVAARDLPPTPSSGIIHGDLFRDQVLFRGGELVALLDFESASAGSPAFDLSVALLAWCFTDHLDAELGRALVAGYVAARPLPDADRASLFHQAQLAAIRFAITRITDFELRPRGAGMWRDYRRFLARLRALGNESESESEGAGAGEEGFLTRLGL